MPLLYLRGLFNCTLFVSIILLHLIICVTVDVPFTVQAFVPSAAETDQSAAHCICTSCVAHIETSCLPVSLSHTPGFRLRSWRAICHAKTGTHIHTHIHTDSIQTVTEVKRFLSDETMSGSLLSCHIKPQPSVDVLFFCHILELFYIKQKHVLTSSLACMLNTCGFMCYFLVY